MQTEINAADKLDDIDIKADILHGLWQLLMRTYQVIFRARQKELNKYGISTRASGVLFTALRYKLATPSLIAKQLVLEPQSVSEQLKRMENDGLIRRLKDLHKKNLIRVEVTDKGREVYRMAAKRETTRRIMSVLTSEEQRELWRILCKLRKGAMNELGMDDSDHYPPENPDEL